MKAIVSLGSNIHPRGEYLRRAREMLSALPETYLLAASSIIETEPEGVAPAFKHMKFLNQIVVFESYITAQQFSKRMHEIELALGRVRTIRNGPRTIDIDLIDFGGLKIDTPELTLPHPRSAGRQFVQRPLAELVAKLGDNALVSDLEKHLHEC